MDLAPIWSHLVAAGLALALVGCGSGVIHGGQADSSLDASAVGDDVAVLPDSAVDADAAVTPDGCVPTTCGALGYACGTWDDACGQTLDCGGYSAVGRIEIGFSGAEISHIDSLGFEFKGSSRNL